MKYREIGSDNVILNARYNSYMGESYSYLTRLLYRKINSENNKDFKIAIDKEFFETLKTVTGTYLTDKEFLKMKENYKSELDEYKKSDYKMIRYIYAYMSYIYGKNKSVNVKDAISDVINMFKEDGLKGNALDHVIMGLKY